MLHSATRTTSSLPTLIDVIQINEPSTITNSETINASLNDHDIRACVRKANNIKYEAETIKCRDFARYNVDIINTELLNADWKSVYDSNCPVHAVKNLMSILVETLNQHAPFITKRVKGKLSLWLTAQVKRHMNVRDQLKPKAKESGKQSYWIAYNCKRNFVNNEIKRAKQSYFNSELQENVTKPKCFWKIIKNLFPTINTCNTTPNAFKIDKVQTTNKSRISEEFCRFFSSITTNLTKSAFKLKVNPVFKTGETHKFDNYRPINILTVISKIFKKCVHNQLMNYLESNKLLSSEQFGFQRKRSTELATAYFIDKIRHAMNKGEYTGAIYVDLGKAFDTISHADS